MSLPWSQACENNKSPIREVLERHFLPRSPADPTLPAQCLARVLEIGGGTGQHAAYFAAKLPWLYWQSSDVAGNTDLGRRLQQTALENLPPPLTLDAQDDSWSVPAVDYVFSANTLHIMSEDAVRGLFRRLPEVLKPDAVVCIYGPFRYGGEFTSASNASFDDWLRQRDPLSGIRDTEFIDELAGLAGLELIEDNRMPANNQLRVWQRVQGP